LPLIVSVIAAIRPSPRDVSVVMCGCLRVYWRISRRRGLTQIGPTKKFGSAPG